MPSRGNITYLDAFAIDDRNYTAITVDAPHGLAPGDYVAVLGTLHTELHANWLVRDVLTHTQFVIDTWDVTAGSSSGTWYQLNGPNGGARLSLARFGDGAGQNVRVTTTDPHGLSAGNSIWIAGTPIVDYNRIHTIRAVISDYDFVLDMLLEHSLDESDLARALWSPLGTDRFEDCSRCLSCTNCECFCHAKTVFRWRGDHNFGDGDIRGLAQFHHKLLNWQDSPTALLWRIRYDLDDENWFEHVRTSGYGALNTGGGLFGERVVDQGGDQLRDPDGTIIQTHHGFLGTSLPGFATGSIPPNPVAAIGPLRNGFIMGTANDNYSRLSAGATPLGFSGLQWSGTLPESYAGGVINAALPWALDVGCVRCRCSESQITWPQQVTHEIIADAIKGDSPPSYPNTPDWVSADYDGLANRRRDHFRTFFKCQTITSAERHKAYWAGDVNNAQIAAPCPADIVIWTHYDPPVNSVSELDWSIESAYRSAAGDEFTTTWWQGWATGSPQSPAVCHLDNIRTIVLEGNVAAGSRSGDFTPNDGAALLNWLATGGKALIIACPYGAGAEIDDGGLLSAIGSSLAIVSSPVSTVFEPNPFEIIPQLTSAGQIGEGVVSQSIDLGDGVSPPGEVTGGTVVELGYYSQQNGFFEPAYPVTAMETLASGSVIVLTTNYRYPETSASRLSPLYTINATRLHTS